MTETSTLTTIAIDAMGGDHGPSVTVPATVEFMQDSRMYARHKIILVGLQEQILPLLQASNGPALLESGHITVVHTSQVVEMHEPPAQALKKKKDSSMRVGVNLVKEGSADAFVSAGNTGALMATARFVLKTIRGVDRPAIVSTMPCKDPNHTVHMLDLGANVDSTPEMLLQFAVMGSVITRYVDRKDKPSVALLNVGEEEIKGSDKVKKASVLLSDSNLNYVGYVEADEIYDGRVDVIVCDGFEGNVALKASEGTAKMILGVLREEFTRNILTKLLAGMARNVFSRMQARLDPRHYNGATLVGLNGIVVKSHGGTDQLGFAHAIQEASRQAERSIIEHISEEVNKHI